MQELSLQQERSLCRLLSELINQNQARILVQPYRAEAGFWFGGSSLAQDQNGVIWLSGRYRNYGDSRTGLAAGQRGVECAIFRSDDRGQNFTKVGSWSKADLSHKGRKVLSIEGTALHQLPDGTWELFVSSEKELSYPEPVEHYQKPGTGIWTIDRLTGAAPAELDPTTLAPVLESLDLPNYLHVKDPVVVEDQDGNTAMIFCSHPFSWTSGNTGLALRLRGEDQFHIRTWELVSRGASWDVAATRITAGMQIPQVGHFAGHPPCSVYFYDGAECVRAHEENPHAYKRPRGFSCEEIGGAFFGWDESFPELKRLSQIEPFFVSPWGTGSSRYVDSLIMEEGILAIWQQSQENGSQPLVGHFLPINDVSQVLAGG